MALVPFGPYLPDQPDFQNPGSNTIYNVIPRTADSYAPAPSLAVITDALDARCQGGIFTRDNESNVFGFAGTADSLYVNTIGTTWYNVGSIPYNTLPEENWNFTVYGELVIATNYTDPIQAYRLTGAAPSNASLQFQNNSFDDLQFVNDVGEDIFFSVPPTQTFASLSVNAPQARYLAVVKDFLMLANTNDSVDGSVPQRVWWSAVDDPTNFPTPGTVEAAQLLSDFNDLAGDGGWNPGIVGGLSGADVIVFQEKRVFRGMFVGPPVIFTFDVVDGARGCPAPSSIVTVGSVCYYLADNGFYACDGITSRPIGQNKVDRTFWETVDQQYLYRVVGAADPFIKIIYWIYPGPQNREGLPNRVLVYHYELDRWSLQGFEAEWLLRSYSTGYTMDGLDIFGTMESMPQISLDSRSWTGGRLSLSGFTPEHKMANFSGPALEATLDTSESQIFDKARGFVSRIWPICDTRDVTMQVGVRDNQYATVAWTQAAPLSAATASCPVRANGFYHRGRMVIPAGTDWNHAQGIEIDASPGGRR